MLIVGSVSSFEEQQELRFIAELAIISARFRFLGQQEKRKKK